MVEEGKSYNTKHCFEKDGKPFYIAGPDDDQQKILEILHNNG